MTLSAPVNATLADGAGLGTILDDGTGTGGINNDTPALLVSDTTGAEQANQFEVFTVFLSNLSTTPVSFSLALADVTALGGGIDYGTVGAGNLQVSTDGGATWTDATTATIAPETTSVLVRTPIVNDSLNENLEFFTLTATRTAGLTVNPDATGTGAISDNDPPPLISINDVTVNEGAGTATFTVSLNTASGLPVSVDYSMTDGTAGAADYTAGSGTLNFAAGETTQTIVVPILEDAIDELDETFTVILSNPSATATIADGTGTGTITDNDATPTLSINDVTVNEAAGTAMFTVTLSAASGLPVSVDFAMANGTATVGADYTAMSGTLNFAPGDLTQTISVPISEDVLDELDETFTVTLSNELNATIADGTGTGTITDNDATPTLSINDVTVNEAAGTASFTVTLSAASGQTVSAAYATANGTAVAGADYTATSGTVSFAPGELTKTITVPISEDALDEADETFSVNLATPTNATIADAQGLGTITDNDAPPTLSINDVTVNEAAGTASFTVTLSAASGQTVSAAYATADGTAVAGADYTATSGTVSFAPGELDEDGHGADQRRRARRGGRDLHRQPGHSDQCDDPRWTRRGDDHRQRCAADVVDQRRDGERGRRDGDVHGEPERSERADCDGELCHSQRDGDEWRGLHAGHRDVDLWARGDDADHHGPDHRRSAR